MSGVDCIRRVLGAVWRLLANECRRSTINDCMETAVLNGVAQSRTIWKHKCLHQRSIMEDWYTGLWWV